MMVYSLFSSDTQHHYLIRRRLSGFSSVVASAKVIMYFVLFDANIQCIDTGCPIFFEHSCHPHAELTGRENIGQWRTVRLLNRRLRDARGQSTRFLRFTLRRPKALEASSAIVARKTPQVQAEVAASTV